MGGDYGFASRDVLEANLGVRWDDIAGLQDAKQVLQENCVLPLLMPKFFQGIRRPVKVIHETWNLGTQRVLVLALLSRSSQAISHPSP